MAIQFSAATTKLLFIGDSITDCDWRKDEEKIGQGYVRMVRDLLAALACRQRGCRPCSIAGSAGTRFRIWQKPLGA